MYIYIYYIYYNHSTAYPVSRNVKNVQASGGVFNFILPGYMQTPILNPIVKHCIRSCVRMGAEESVSHLMDASVQT